MPIDQIRSFIGGEAVKRELCDACERAISVDHADVVATVKVGRCDRMEATGGIAKTEGRTLQLQKAAPRCSRRRRIDSPL